MTNACRETSSRLPDLPCPFPTKPLVQLDKEQPHRETETKALWTEIVTR